MCIINSSVQGTVGFFSKIVFHEIHTLINAAFLIFAKCIKKKKEQWELLAPLLVCVGKHQINVYTITTVSFLPFFCCLKA